MNTTFARIAALVLAAVVTGAIVVGANALATHQYVVAERAVAGSVRTSAASAPTPTPI